MTNVDKISTLKYYPQADGKHRVFALYYFCTFLIVWTVLGHSALGFEQSWMQPGLAVAVACATQLLLEWLDAKATGRQIRFTQSLNAFLVCLMPAMISGLAIGMLLFAGGYMMPVVFASVLAIASKVLFRAPVGDSTQHIYNPSNFGITITLLLFPWVAIAPPYHFTENISGIWNWLTPAFILMTGIFLHARSTARLPLILSWIVGFLLQGFIRHQLFSINLLVQFLPMTSAAFIVFTLYMIPDPATTPIKLRGQIAFGLSVALIYGLLVVLHVPYGLFVALTLVSTIRGIGLYILTAVARNKN
ncbi:MAG: RnfABCDGE type electron transport complex subunit D [Candidatus Obscuribacterales bacterium]|nr:RnfABCDGE type electron transport complex subunit D [Candidatus Obscuribacterales bacterium]